MSGDDLVQRRRPCGNLGTGWGIARLVHHRGKIIAREQDARKSDCADRETVNRTFPDALFCQTRHMKWTKVFACVSGGALIGMLMGGLFGYGSGTIAPDFFTHTIPWKPMEPKGLATFLGATAGVSLGGGVACFGILIQLVGEWRGGKNSPSGEVGRSES